MTRIGKIARLPQAIREELNQRLRDGQLSPVILPWLNARPETQALLQAEFDGAPVSGQNLSAWRQGGYADWLEQEKILKHVRELTDEVMKLVQTGNTQLAQGACVLAGAQTLELLLACDGKDVRRLEALIRNVMKLRRAEIAQQRADIHQAGIKQRDEALRLKRARFDLQLCESAQKQGEKLTEPMMEKLIAASGLERIPKAEAVLIAPEALPENPLDRMLVRAGLRPIGSNLLSPGGPETPEPVKSGRIKADKGTSRQKKTKNKLSRRAAAKCSKPPAKGSGASCPPRRKTPEPTVAAAIEPPAPSQPTEISGAEAQKPESSGESS